MADCRASEKETREYAESIINTVREPLIVLDQDLRLISASRSFYAAFKVKPEESEGCLIYDLANKQWDIPELRQLLETLLPQKTTLEDYKIEHEFADLGRRTMLLNARQIQRAPGKDPIILLAIENVTDRKRTEQALRRERDLTRRYLDTTQAIMMALDPEGRITMINRSGRELLGYAEDEILGCNWFENFLPQPEGMDSVYPVFTSIMAGDLSSTDYFENSVVCRDGTQRLIGWNNAFLEDDEGRVIGTLSSGEDITEHKQSEAKLAEQHALLEAIYSNAPLMMMVVDGHRRLRQVNGFATQFAGRPAEEMLGLRGGEALRCLHALDDPRGCGFGEFCRNCVIRNKVLQTLEYGMSNLQFEASFDFYSGDRMQALTLLVSTTPITFQGENMSLVTIMDITDRKQAEEAIENERAYLSAVIDNIGEAIVICDAEGRIFRFNETARRLHGMPEEPVPSDQWAEHYDLYREDGITPLATEDIPLFRALQGQLVQNAEIVVAPKHSRPYSLVCNGQALTDETGKITGAVVAMHDITERKQTEETLRRSENYYRAIFETSGSAMFIIEEDTTISHVNSNFEKMLGYAKQEVEGKKSWTEFIHADDVGWMKKNHYLRRGDPRSVPFNYEFRFFARNGDLRHGFLTVDIISETAQSVASVIDITERKQAEETSARLQEQFHQVQKLESVGRLAGGVAHDLNNLLSPILGYGEMLLEDAPANDPRLEPMEEIVSAGKRAQALVRQLLAFSRKQPLQFQSIDINDLLKGFRKLLRRTLREDINIQIHFGESIPQVEGDVGQIEQVIMNLVVNAQDAMPGGGTLTIETAQVDLDENYAKQKNGVTAGPYVMLAISDNGAGMDEETLKHLFEPFFTTKEQGKGTGLGMSTAYGIIKQHGGNIWAYSEPGQGTTIKIYLPLPTKTREVIPHAEDRKPVSKGVETVLLAEDDQQVRHLTTAILERYGYQVIVAGNGQEAISALKKHEGPIDLLITDVIMPDMNGKELYNRLSKDNPETRVLYMSGYTDNVIAHHGVIDPGVNFIEKPFNVKALAAKVRQVLEE